MPRTVAPAAVTVAALLCAACASPIKPAVVDTSGSKVRQLAVQAKFQNTGGNARLKPADLASEYVRAMEQQAPKATEGGLTIARTPATASHVLTVEATLLSRTSVVPGYWDSCMYKTKDGHCQGGQQADTVNYSRMRLHLQVVDKATGKTVYKSDDSASGTVAIDDRGIDSAAGNAARATLKALKESGLI